MSYKCQTKDSFRVCYADASGNTQGAFNVLHAVLKDLAQTIGGSWAKWINPYGGVITDLSVKALVITVQEAARTGAAVPPAIQAFLQLPVADNLAENAPTITQALAEWRVQILLGQRNARIGVIVGGVVVVGLVGFVWYTTRPKPALQY